MTLLSTGNLKTTLTFGKNMVQYLILMPLVWTSVAAFFEGLGVLVKKEFIEIGLVHDFLGSVIIQAWEKMGPVFLESRKINNTKLWNEFEYLYNEIKKLE